MSATVKKEGGKKKVKKFLVTAVLSLSMVLGFSAFAFAEETAPPDFPPDSYDITGTIVKDADFETQQEKDAENDNELINANKTGVGVGGQNPANFTDDNYQSVQEQRTHGEYKNNTNSCASCHQTHTAAGDALLFKNDVYDTCTACHDGTLGVLNVFAPSTAGTFGGTEDGNASIHMVAGGMDVKAAPGGNRSPEDTDSPWNAEFDCASCHSPHSSYSDRLLNYNPNQIGSTDMYFRNEAGDFTDKDGVELADQTKPVKSGGLKVVGAQVYDTLPTVTPSSPEYVVYRTINSNLGADKVTQENDNEKVIVLMKKGSTAYVRDKNPWIGNVYNTRGNQGLDEITNFYVSYTYGSATNINKINLVKFSATGQAVDDGIVVKFGQAYVKNGQANGIDQVGNADISRATLVKFNFLTQPKGTFNGIDILEVNTNTYNTSSGLGDGISGFCAACHTDYYTKSGNATTGIWSKAFRHNTTTDSYTCLKCHFAHGSDVTVILDAQDQSVESLSTPVSGEDAKMTEEQAIAYLKDVNPSSALKRYTNMSVCWKCHTSSHSEDMTNNIYVQGALNAGVTTPNEYKTPGTDLPHGFVAPNQADLPYAGNHN